MQELIIKAVEAKLAHHGVTWARVRALRIDRDAKLVATELELEGEADAVHASVGYVLEGDTLRIHSVDASRPWIAGALRLALERHGGEFPLPSGFQGGMIRMFL